MLLARTGAERLAMGSEMFEVARTIILASFPRGLSDIEIKERLCERLYGSQVNIAAFSSSLRIRSQLPKPGP